MARLITNRKNWWRGDEENENEAMNILVAVAKLTLRRCDPGRTQWVQEGDLISEGWLKVARYIRDFDPQWFAYDCSREMNNIYWRLRRFDKREVSVLDDIDTTNFRYAGDPILCLEWWDMVVSYGSARQAAIVADRFAGEDPSKSLGLSYERCRQLRHELVGTMMKDVDIADSMQK